MTTFLILLLLESLPFAELIREGIEMGYRENYPLAESLLLEVTEKFPESPLGPLFYAGLLDLYMLDFSTDERKDDFFRYLDEAIERAEKMIKGRKYVKGRELAWAYFSKGSALAYKAMFYGRKRKFPKALYYAFPARKNLLKAVEADSTLYDAYLPLGTYHYAISELPRFIRWLTGSGDKRAQALKEMRLAASRSEFVRVIAQDALAWTLAYQRSFREAEELSRRLVSSYPESRSFRWTLCYVLRRSGKWREAKNEYKKLLYLVMRDQRKCPYCLAIAFLWVAKSEFFSMEREAASRDAYSGLVLTRKIGRQKDKAYLLKNLNWILQRAGGTN